MDYYALTQSMGLAQLAIFTAYNSLILEGTGLIRVVNPPVSSTSAGISGYNVAFSGDYFYACTGNNQWGRTQISKFSQPIYCNNSEYYCNNNAIYCNASAS
jgi:hypothetical protein